MQIVYNFYAKFLKEKCLNHRYNLHIRVGYNLHIRVGGGCKKVYGKVNSSLILCFWRSPPSLPFLRTSEREREGAAGCCVCRNCLFREWRQEYSSPSLSFGSSPSPPPGRVCYTLTPTLIPTTLSWPLLDQVLDSWLLPRWSILGDPLVPTTRPGNIFESYLFKIGAASSNNSHDADDSGKVAVDGSKTIANAVAMVMPSLVHISVPKRRDGKGSVRTGSGTIIDTNGTILTCAHLVSNVKGMKVTSKVKVDVTLQDGRTLVGEVLNVDLHSDIALVKITSRSSLPAAKLGFSSSLRPGDQVVAMGSPCSLQSTVTAGIVSYVNRKSSEFGREGMLREYIQVDCAVNPGNSGGPLVNLDGEVVGVNVMRIRTGICLNLSVPIDAVSKIMEQFKKNGRVIRPWIGLKMLDLNEATISHLKAKDPMFPNVRKGVLVFMVTPGSPADIAGICPGDVVIEFHGKHVSSITEIIGLMGDEVGKAFEVVVKRKKDIKKTLTVVTEDTSPEIE